MPLSTDRPLVRLDARSAAHRRATRQAAGRPRSWAGSAIGFVWTLLIAATPGGARAESPIDLALYARLLERHTVAVAEVVGTRVDYRALQTSGEWPNLVAQVRAARPSALSRGEQLAYWINAYNILTLDLVQTHYPIDSIRDIGSFFSPVWNRTVATIEGRALSLGAIEHEILRKLDEPRIHAAIVCASTSCPSLRRTPYRAASLDEDLDEATRGWLRDRRKGLAIDRANRTVRVSKIFDWFEEDFSEAGGVLAFAAPYLPEPDADWLAREGDRARFRYFDYDWTLNARR